MTARHSMCHRVEMCVEQVTHAAAEQTYIRVAQQCAGITVTHQGQQKSYQGQTVLPTRKHVGRTMPQTKDLPMLLLSATYALQVQCALLIQTGMVCSCIQLNNDCSQRVQSTSVIVSQKDRLVWPTLHWYTMIGAKSVSGHSL